MELGEQTICPPLVCTLLTTGACPLPDLSNMTGFAPCAAASSKAAAASNKDDMWEDAANAQ